MAHHRTILAFFLIFAAFARIPGQPLSTIRNDIRARSASGESAEVLLLLEKLKDLHPRTYKSDGFAYAAGRAFENDGDAGAAARNYLEALGGNPLTEPYAFWRLARLMRRAGNLPAERLFLLSALSRGRESAAAFTAGERLPFSWYESGNHSSALRSVRMKPGGEKGGSLRESLVLMGRAYRQIEDLKASEETFRQVIDQMPDPERPDDLALAAAEGLDLIAVGEAEYGRKVPDLSAEGHFERANIYQHNRRFRAAALHYGAIINRFPDSALAAPAAFRTGRGFAQERDYQNAIEWFERVIEQYPESDQAKQAVYQSAGAFANVGKPKEAESRFRKFISMEPGSERAADAYLNIIDLQRDNGESAPALTTADRILAEFTDKETLAAAHFAKARIRMSQNDWGGALKDLENLKSTGLGTGVPGEAAFLKGFVLEKLGRGPEAIEAYLETSPGYGSYYGSVATERLQAIARDSGTDPAIAAKIKSVTSSRTGTPEEERRAAEAAFRLAADQDSRTAALNRLAAIYRKEEGFEMPNAREFAPSDLVPTAAGDPARHGRIAEGLLRLGVFDEGAVEAELFFADSTAVSDKEARLAEAYKNGGLVTRSVALAEGRWKRAPGRFPAEAMPEDELRALYPAPFRKLVLRYAKAEGLDPRFVLSIMRQESRFDPDVKSSAAARGLMQFIPSTASGIAEKLEIGDYSQDDLYDPAGAIRIGSRYLANLFRDFPDQPAAVAASYNAGEDRMMKWFRRAGAGEPERYVPEIRFDQTRDYVAKVMNNYRIYRMLYDENLEITGR